MNRIAVLALLTFASSGLLAQTDWKKASLTPSGVVTNDGRLVTTVADAAGRVFTINHRSVEIDDIDVARIRELHEKIAAWSNLAVGRLSYRVNEDRVEVLVVPQKLEVQGTNLLSYLPAGLTLTHGGATVHDFRMVVSNLFVRLKARFDSGVTLEKKMLQAVANPQQYILKNDPDYFADRMNENEDLQRAKFTELEAQTETLRQALVALQNTGFFRGPRAVPVETIEKIVALRKANAKLDRKAFGDLLKAQNVKAENKEINLVLAVYLGELPLK